MTAAETPAAGMLLERPPVDWERHKGDKRPKILPPPGETWRNPATNRKVGHRYYTRVTTYADAITESYNLTNWKLAKLLIGLGQRADYVRQAAALTMDDRDRDARDELVGKVLDAAGPDAAGLGTALHALTERLDRGEDIGTPPDEMLPDLAAYTAVTEGVLGIRWREPRTVCDELECAGTPDTIATVSEAPPTGEGLPVCDCPPDRLRVVDTKTGSIRYPGKMSTQLAIYSRSALYDPGTGERTPLDVCPHWGVIVHLPVETGTAALFWLDLEHGWRGAELCGPVRQWHKAKADDILLPFGTVKPVKVVDGEVTRTEPRLASTNPKTPTPAPAEPGDVTELLAASLEARGAGPSADELAEPRESEDAADLDGTDEPSDYPTEAFASVDQCDVRVVGTDDNGAPVHWCADHDSAWPHEAASDPLDGRVAEAVHRALVGDEADRPAPLPDSCAHSGSRFIGPGGLTCRDCGEVLNATTPRTPAADVDPVPTGQGSPMLDGGDPDDGEAFDGSYLDALADAEELASGPDSDAEDDDEPADGSPPGDEPAEVTDPIAAAITRCTHSRDLELLGTLEWRTWTAEHKALVSEVHDRLKAAEDADAPRAATEAAINAAETVEALTAVMLEVRDAPHMTGELFALADARYWHLKGARGRAAREGATR